MTARDFIKLLHRLDNSIEKVPSDVRLPAVAFVVAGGLWTQQAPETDDSRELRLELQYLLKNKKFSWQE